MHTSLHVAVPLAGFVCLRLWPQPMHSLNNIHNFAALLCRFTSTQAAEKAFHEHMQRGYTVAPGNVPLFEQVTEAAEVLLDAGQGNIYSTTKEQLVQQLKQAHQAELAPAEAAPSRDDAAAVAAVLAGDTAEERAEGAHEELHLGAAYGTELPRRHKPPPPAAPAAAAEPPVRGGSSVPFAAPQPPLLAQRAELGFAKEVQHDAELERREAGPLPPPKVHIFLQCVDHTPAVRRVCLSSPLAWCLPYASRVMVALCF